MAKVVARNCDLFAKGRELSGQMNAIMLGLTAEAPNVTSFGDLDQTRLADTLKDVEMTINGFWDAAASQVDEQFQSILSSCTYYGLYPESASAGYKGREMQCIMTEYSIESGVADATGVSANIAGSSDVYRGISNGYDFVSSSGAASMVSVDNGASTATVLALFRLIEFEGTTMAASYVHSSDNVSFSTLLDFGTFNSPNQVAASTVSSASRYRGISYNLTGTNASATIQGFSGSKS